LLSWAPGITCVIRRVEVSLAGCSFADGRAVFRGDACGI